MFFHIKNYIFYFYNCINIYFIFNIFNNNLLNNYIHDRTNKHLFSFFKLNIFFFQYLKEIELKVILNKN